MSDGLAANNVHGTPSYLIPKMGEHAVANTSFYQRLFITDLNEGRRRRKELDRALDPFAEDRDNDDDTVQLQNESRPALGVLLTYEQGWFQEGLALGTLLHSLCLAPGEVTKVAVVDWRRQARASDSVELIEETEQVQASEQKSNAKQVENLVQSSLRAGNSLAFGESTQKQAGGTFGSIFGGASASTATNSSLGMTASMSVGSDNVAAESTEELSQRTLQAAESTSAQRSTQVRELSEQENETVSTRVVANYNHMYAMTVQYYEVLQVYALKTRVTKAERCLFIPLNQMPFNFKTVLENRARLLPIIRALGNETLKMAIEDLDKQADAIESELAELREQVTTAKTGAQQARADLQEHQSSRPARDEVPESVRHLMPPPGPARDRFIAERGTLSNWRSREFALSQAVAAADRDVALASAAVDAKLAAKRTENELLLDFLDKNRLFFNQQMWMRLDAYTVHRMVHHYRFEGEPLTGLIDPRPVGTFGHYLAFRWTFDVDKAAERTAFKAKYEQSDNDAVAIKIVLPTDGVFAEAVLGQSNAAEELDLTRFWNWADSPIPILPPDMRPVGRTSDGQSILPTGQPQFSQPLPFLQAPAMSPFAGMDVVGVLGAIKEAGLAGGGAGDAADLAGRTGERAAAGAADATAAAVESHKSYTKFVTDLANSDLVKTVATTALPAGKGASLIGGLMNAGKKAIATKGDGDAG